MPGRASPDPKHLRSDFDRAHDERYGYSDPDAELELVTIRVAAAIRAPSPPPPRPRRRRSVAHDACASATRRWSRILGPGEAEVDGPAIFELPGATLVVPPGWHAQADADGAVMQR